MEYVDDFTSLSSNYNYLLIYSVPGKDVSDTMDGQDDLSGRFDGMNFGGGSGGPGPHYEDYSGGSQQPSGGYSDGYKKK